MNYSAGHGELIVISYIQWHYTLGLKDLIRILRNISEFIFHYFSIVLLAKTLFSPFKRSYKSKQRPGISLSDFFDRLSFNLISRIIGAVIRIIVLATGISFLVLWQVISVILIVFWLIIPGISFPFYYLEQKAIVRYRIIRSLLYSPQKALQKIFNTSWGKFVTRRLGILPQDLIDTVESTLDINAERIDASYMALFLALFDSSQRLQNYFFERAITREDIVWVSTWYDRLEKNTRKQKTFWERDWLLHIPSIGKTWGFGFTPLLDKYTTDLSKVPTPFSYFVARTLEIETIERILTKKTQANVLLVGEPGVGKHPLVIHFAHLVSEGRVLPQLESKRILQLNLEEVFREELDVIQRKTTLTLLLEEATAAGNILLVIDELDRFVASGADRIDVSDVFLHSLNQNSLQMIAIVTTGAYHQYIKTNTTLNHQFDTVTMLSLGKDDALKVIADILPEFEDSSRYFLYEAIRELVQESDRLIKDIPFPEKAIKLLDEVVALSKNRNKTGEVTANDIRKYLTEITSVPVALVEEDKEKLIHLEEYLHKRVIGQDAAINAVSQAMRRARSEVSARGNKPIGSFLFLGPTGVGKTETAKALAEVYFGNDSAFIRFDMSEYKDSSAIKQFLGDFTGGKVGVFSQKISENPYTVLLLDEIEKADRSILNLFLTALDEGYMTDAFGKKIYLTNMIIIATSNAGSEYIRNLVHSGSDTSSNQKLVVDYVQKEGIFTPEFLNRFDSVIVFHPLLPNHTEQIFLLAFARLAKKIYEEKGIILELTPETKMRVLTDGFNPEYGGRALNRAVQTYLEEPLAQKILQNKIRRGMTVTL